MLFSIPEFEIEKSFREESGMKKRDLEINGEQKRGGGRELEAGEVSVK